MTATLTPPVTSASPAPLRRSRGERGALAALLVGTGALYLWNLSANGWANDFYAMAVRSMTTDWKAFFFASLDAGNTVTVDKPPASLWIMALSGRIFGFSSWSMLVPQALMGVATVAVLYAAVRRVAGPRAGLLAGAAMALTPVAALMFRFNNPDALLVLLMVAAAYATVRAIEKGGTRWLLLAGLLLGFGFLAKMLQAFVVLPALALAYLIAAPVGMWRRVWQLLAAGGAVVVGSGWWIAIAELWPADSRPYIGGSTNNSVLELALGYNGLGRIFGNGRGGGGPGSGQGGGLVIMGSPPAGAAGGPPEMIGGGPGGGGFGGASGLQRLFSGEIGGQVTWLLPAAFLLLVAGLWLAWRHRDQHRELRASLILWGGWTVVTFLVFSLAEGIFHPYYTVALAPGIAALVGIGGVLLWRERSALWVRAVLALAVAGTAAWSFVLLDRSPEYLPWLRWVVLAAGVIAVLGIVAPLRARAVTAGTLVAVAVAGLAAPAAYSVTTVATAHTGSIPSAGPQVAGLDVAGPGRQRAAGDRQEAPAGARQFGPGQFGPGGPARVDAEVVDLLRSAGTDWSAAIVGSMGAGGLALASNTDVMAIGGFSGGDPAPTLAQFQAEVAAGRIHWFVGSERGGPGGAPGTAPGTAPGSGPGGPGGRRGSGAEITTWVEQTFTARTVGGQTLYDLTSPK